MVLVLLLVFRFRCSWRSSRASACDCAYARARAGFSALLVLLLALVLTGSIRTSKKLSAISHRSSLHGGLVGPARGYSRRYSTCIRCHVRGGERIDVSVCVHLPKIATMRLFSLTNHPQTYPLPRLMFPFANSNYIKQGHRVHKWDII